MSPSRLEEDVCETKRPFLSLVSSIASAAQPAALLRTARHWCQLAFNFSVELASVPVSADSQVRREVRLSGFAARLIKQFARPPSILRGRGDSDDIIGLEVELDRALRLVRVYGTNVCVLALPPADSLCSILLRGRVRRGAQRDLQKRTGRPFAAHCPVGVGLAGGWAGTGEGVERCCCCCCAGGWYCGWGDGARWYCC